MDSCDLFAVVFVCVKVCPYGIVLRVVTPVVFPFCCVFWRVFHFVFAELMTVVCCLHMFLLVVLPVLIYVVLVCSFCHNFVFCTSIYISCGVCLLFVFFLGF